MPPESHAQEENPAAQPAQSAQPQPAPSQPAQPTVETPAAEVPPTETPPAETPPTETEPADPAPTAPEASAETESLDHFIYIPYEKWSSLIDQFKSKVVISYEEYQQLLKRVKEAEQAQPPAVSALLTSAQYTAVVRGEIAEITAQLHCRALQKQWAELPVQFGGAAVGEITTEGEQKVLLRGVGDGQYQLLFEQAGDYQITLKLMAAVKQAPNGASLDLTVPSVGVTRFQLTVPKANQEIKIEPRHIPLKEQPPAAAEQSQISVQLGATEKITARWTSRTEERPAAELLATATNQLQVLLGDGLMHTQADLEYRVLRGELTTIRLAASLEQRLLDVTSSHRIQNWTVEKEDLRQLITVQLASPVKDKIRLEVHTEQKIPQEAFSVAGIAADKKVEGVHALDVTREQGKLTLTHGQELALIVEKQTGLVRTESAQNNPQQLTYRYFTPDFDFKVRAEPVQPVLDVNQQAWIILREQRTELQTDFRYKIQKTGIFQLNFQLPEGFKLQSVTCPAMSEFQHQPEQNQLTILLKEQTQGNLAVNVRGFLPPVSAEGQQAGEPTEAWSLPLIEPLHTRQEEGLMAVYTVPALELVSEETEWQAAQSVPINLISQRFPDTILRAAWKFQSRPVVVPVRTFRRPTRITATNGTQIKIEPNGIRVHSEIAFQMEYAGMDRFRIAVPTAIQNRLQVDIVGDPDVPILQKTYETGAEIFRTESIENTEKSSTESTTVDNSEWTVLVIQTQRPVTGTQRFQLSYDLPFTEQDPGAIDPADKKTNGEAESAARSQTFLLSGLRPLGLKKSDNMGSELARSSGEIMVSSDSALTVTAVPAGSRLDSIDPRELTLIPSPGQQAFRYAGEEVTKPVQLQLTVSRFEVEEVVSTVVSRMLTEFVLGTSEDLAVRTRMRIKTSQRQRLQVFLPAQSQPMLVQLNGETRQLQKGETSDDSGWTHYFVNVNRAGNSEQEFELTIQYLQTIVPLARYSLRGELHLPLLQVLTPTAQPALVQQSRCDLWLPQDYVPVTVEDPFNRLFVPKSAGFFAGVLPNNDQRHENQQWIAGNHNKADLDFPTSGDLFQYESLGTTKSLELTYWNRDYVLSGLTLTLLVIALILRNTSWENKIFVLIISLTVIVIGMQYEPDVFRQATSSARFGLLALASLWVVHGAFQCCSWRRNPMVEEIDTTTNLGKATTSPPSDVRTEEPPSPEVGAPGAVSADSEKADLPNSTAEDQEKQE